MENKVIVQVPATSANLGAGFDALGVAIQLYNKIEVQEAEELLIESMDNVKIPTDKGNLVYKSIREMYDIFGVPFKSVHIKQWNNIPLSRGLGSSSACIVGGMTAANEMLGRPCSQRQLLEIATMIEGHPDNVAPAILGGLSCSVMDKNKVHYIREDIAHDIDFVVIIPDTELETVIAREALPKMVSHEDARYNLSRAALMALSLKDGVYHNLKYGAQDKLHQPYRFPYIENAQNVIDYCYELDAYAAMISGAGSTLMAIVDRDKKEFITKMREHLDKLGHTNWQVAGYLADNVGARVL